MCSTEEDRGSEHTKAFSTWPALHLRSGGMGTLQRLQRKSNWPSIPQDVGCLASEPVFCGLLCGCGKLEIRTLHSKSDSLASP